MCQIFFGLRHLCQVPINPLKEFYFILSKVKYITKLLCWKTWKLTQNNFFWIEGVTSRRII